MNENEAPREGRGRSKKKRAAKAVEALAYQLIELPRAQLRNVPLNGRLREEVHAARATKGRGSRKRQAKYLAGLLRSRDEERAEIEAFLDGDSGASPSAAEVPQPRYAGLPQLTLTIIAVTDVRRSRRFYTEGLGWPVRVETPSYYELELPDGRGFGLYDRESFANNTGISPTPVGDGAISASEFYLRCEDLDAAILRLEEAGALTLSRKALRPWGDEAAYFADPDGNVIVLARAAPPEE